MSESRTASYMAAARAALAKFEIRSREIYLHSIAENVTFRVVDASNGNSYALRLHRPGYRTLNELESEHTWTLSLRQSGMSVPQPLVSPAGAAYVLVDIGHTGETRLAGVAQWLPGKRLSACARSDNEAPQVMQAIMARLGELLARMHVCASRWQAPEGFQRPHLGVEALIGEAPHWGRFWEHPALESEERASMLNARDCLHQQLCELDKDRARYGLIHSDLHPDNVLVEGQGLSAIDFDDVAYGWYEYDLAAALQPHLEHPEYPQWRAALLKSYVETRNLPGVDEQLLDSFILVRDLAEVGWYMQRPEIEALNRLHFHSIKARALRECRRMQQSSAI